VELVALFLVLPAQVVNLSFVVSNRFQKLVVRFLPLQKLLHNFLNVRVASLSSDFLKSLLVLRVSFHFTVHLVFQKARVKLLSQKVLLHLQFV
jgi:hypothetical protein